MIWLPTLRRRILSREETYELGLGLWYRWEACELAWLNFGMILWVAPIGHSGWGSPHLAVAGGNSSPPPQRGD